MSMISLHKRRVEIPLQGMEFVSYSMCGGYWNLLIVNLFMPPLNILCFDSIPRRGNYRNITLILSTYLSFYFTMNFWVSVPALMK